MELLSDKLLYVLYERSLQNSAFISASELAESVGVSISQINPAIEELREKGFEISYSPSRGFALEGEVKLDGNLILRNLNTHRIGKWVLCFDSVGSTNDVAMDAAVRNNTDGLVVTAESQATGRGTRGRKWQARAGSAILASCTLIDKPAALDAEPLTIAAGLAVAQGIEKACGISTSIKWPNDVYINSAKTAGVLLEVQKTNQNKSAMVIGFGINITDHPPENMTRRPATCISKHSTCTNRIEILREILRKLDYWVAAVLRCEFDELCEQWKQRCWMLNERISVQYAGEKITGRVIDIDPVKGLILATDGGGHVPLKAEFSTIL